MATDPGSFTIDALLCDSCAAVEGKIYIQGGGWNVLNTIQFPFMQSRVGVAAIIGVPYPATNKTHEFRIHLYKEDGELMPLGAPVPDPNEPTGFGRPTMIGAQFNVGRPPLLRSGERQNIPVAINLDQLVFDSPGVYSFVLRIGGEEINRLNFEVRGPQMLTIGHASNDVARDSGD